MKRKTLTKEEEENDPIKKMNTQKELRRKIQIGNMKMYEHAKNIIKDEIDDNQGTDIMERMLYDRRGYVNEYKSSN